MTNKISEIKRNTELKLVKLRLKRKQVISQFKRKLEEEKIQQIKNSILNNQ